MTTRNQQKSQNNSKIELLSIHEAQLFVRFMCKVRLAHARDHLLQTIQASLWRHLATLRNPAIVNPSGTGL